MSLTQKLLKFEKFIGRTPTYELDFPFGNLFAKLEFGSFMGSIKDRAAFYCLKMAIESGEINEKSTVIESSSGNFAIGLAGISRVLGLKFIAVVDPKITAEKEKYISSLAHRVVKVKKKDPTGGYLLSRIETVKELIGTTPNSFNINQYENQNNYLSYYHTLGNEIVHDFDSLDYLFAAVSTGGTVKGLTMRLKEHYPDIRIVAVDIEGSLAMGGKPKNRNISGLGSSQESRFIELDKVDHVVILSESEIIKGCNELFQEQMVFGGGSSGAVYAAAKKVLAVKNDHSKKGLIICPDRGHAYLDIIYNNKKEEKNEVLGFEQPLTVRV